MPTHASPNLGIYPAMIGGTAWSTQTELDTYDATELDHIRDPRDGDEARYASITVLFYFDRAFYTTDYDGSYTRRPCRDTGKRVMRMG